MAVEVRLITEEDIRGFHAALDAVARERQYLAMAEAPPIESTREFVRGNIEKGIPQFVAVAEGRVVGWCDIIPRKGMGFQHCGELGMGVVAAFRRQGVGAALLAAALARAEAIGLERVDLLVFGANAPAIALYKKFGFVEEVRRRKGRKVDGAYEDVLGMGLRLGEALARVGLWRELLMPTQERPPAGERVAAEIRPATEEDVEGYHAVVDAVARERRYLGRVEAPPIEKSREYVRENIRKGDPHFVAVVEGRVVGTCDIDRGDRFGFEHTGHLAMAVLREFRRQGIGSRLLSAALGRAEAIGLERVDLGVYASNTAAIGLYGKHGFVEEGRRPNARKLDGVYDDLVVMGLIFGSGAGP